MTRRFLRSVPAALAVAALLAFGGQLLADDMAFDWPQFRGPERDGVSRETGLLSAWPEGGPEEVWRRPIGEGYSGLSVVGGRIYTMFAEEVDGEPTELAAAFDAATGEELWRTPIGERLDTEFGNGPRSTPTVDGDAVYVLGSHGELAALAAADGTRRWLVKLTEAFGSQRPYWGFSASVLVDNDKVIVEAGGGEGKSYAALARATGETVWTVGDARGPGHNSPLAVTVGGKRRYVFVAGETLMAIDSDGKEVWSHAWPRGETHAMPVFVPPDRIFASGAQGVGATVVQVVETGDQVKAEAVWKSEQMKNHFSSSVLHGDTIYGFDNATLKAVSAATGEVAWVKRGLGKGSLILADGHLVILSDQGRLVLAEATPERFVEQGGVQALEGRCWTSPTLAGGRLYLRNHDQMVSYRLRGSGGTP